MAKCDYCNEDMLNDGKTYYRIAVGKKYDFYYGKEDEEIRCYDCGALMGHYHHSNCDCKVYPKCYKQLIDCNR